MVAVVKFTCLALVWITRTSSAESANSMFYSPPNVSPHKGHALLLPKYMEAGEDRRHLMAKLAITGLTNRAAAAGTPGARFVWLNASSSSWVNGVPVMWPYPSADVIWLDYLRTAKGIAFNSSRDGSLCTMINALNAVELSMIRGLIIYEASETINSLQYIAVSAAGLYDSIPVTLDMTTSLTCLKRFNVVFTVPSVSNFPTDLSAYAWAAETLLPYASTSVAYIVLVGACASWANYTCGWSDPLGTATIDFAVSQRAMVINLSPDSTVHPDQANMFQRFASHIHPFGAFSGWAEPEPDMVALLSKSSVLVLCGAPNLSFLSSIKVDTTRLPPAQTRVKSLNKSGVYLTFQSNEGDTPKNAYSFRGGNWLSPERGGVEFLQIVNTSSGLIKLFRFMGILYVLALLQYDWIDHNSPACTDVKTSTSADSFFGATGGVGYTYPWSLPNPETYFDKATSLFNTSMPFHETWVDMWEGSCPKNTSANPCLAMYSRFAAQSQGTVVGFSQQPTLPQNQQNLDYVYNGCLNDDTPIVVAPSHLWYATDKGYCNGTIISDEVQCIESLVRRAITSNSKRPLFIVTYGTDNYVDVASAVQRRMSVDVHVVGTNDLSQLGRSSCAMTREAAQSKPQKQ